MLVGYTLPQNKKLSIESIVDMFMNVFETTACQSLVVVSFFNKLLVLGWLGRVKLTAT